MTSHEFAVRLANLVHTPGEDYKRLRETLEEMIVPFAEMIRNQTRSDVLAEILATYRAYSPELRFVDYLEGSYKRTLKVEGVLE